MKSYIAFVKKEFSESWRTYKLMIVLVVFLALGMLNPLTAKLLPELLKTVDTEGYTIIMNMEPSALDSWAQFYKNIPEMGLVVIVILFSGMMSTEYTKGTLINMLTKGLSRKNVIFAKLTMAFTLWTLSYVICFLTTYGYTAYFWKDNGLENLVLAGACLWMFGNLLITMVMFFGVIVKGGYGSLLLTVVGVGTMFMINILPKFREYNPLFLASGNIGLINKSVEASTFMIPFIVSLVLSVGFIVGSVVVFNKKQL